VAQVLNGYKVGLVEVRHPRMGPLATWNKDMHPNWGNLLDRWLKTILKRHFINLLRLKTTITHLVYRTNVKANLKVIITKSAVVCKYWIKTNNHRQCSTRQRKENKHNQVIWHTSILIVRVIDLWAL